MKIPVHPYAEEIPRMTKEEFKELVEDIRVHGLKEKIILYEDQILDGRHRAEALEELGWPLEEYVEEYDMSEGHPLAYVISRNIARRHLTVGQRAGLVVSMYKHLPKSKGGRPRKVDNEGYDVDPDEEDESSEIGSGSGRKPVSNVTRVRRPVQEIELVNRPTDVQPSVKELAKKANVNERAIKRARAKQEGRNPKPKPTRTMICLEDLAKEVRHDEGGALFEKNGCSIALGISQEARQKIEGLGWALTQL